MTSNSITVSEGLKLRVGDDHKLYIYDLGPFQALTHIGSALSGSLPTLSFVCGSRSCSLMDARFGKRPNNIEYDNYERTSRFQVEPEWPRKGGILFL